jgi:hypothetical protein
MSDKAQCTVFLAAVDDRAPRPHVVPVRRTEMNGSQLRFACSRCGLAVTRQQARRVVVVGVSVWYCKACWLAIQRELDREREA